MSLEIKNPFWNYTPQEAFINLKSNEKGLSSREAHTRRIQYGSNRLKGKSGTNVFILFFSQFKSPLLLLLIFAAILSFYLNESINSMIILSIVFISGVLGFWQEYTARGAIEKLLNIVKIRTSVIRNGDLMEIPFDNVVPGDIVSLKAGDAIPADCLILECKDLFVDEATLTGETYPIEKFLSTLPEDIQLNKRTNCLWTGTHVISGNCTALAVFTGRSTELGKISERLRIRPPETEFERGIRKFGNFLMEVTLILVVAIFGVNVFLQRPVMDTFLFSVALAVGLTPQLLPVIISINLSHGAKEMAKVKVVIKRLASIENFGSMNIFCSDKTGTLTEGNVQIHKSYGVEGQEDENVLFHAYLNSFFETGFINPIDEAIRKSKNVDISNYRKIDEIPYDFLRKRLTILLEYNKRSLMVTKGAVRNILEVCTKARLADGSIVDIKTIESDINENYNKLSTNGFRTLGVAIKSLESMNLIHKSEEVEMTFIGFLALMDPIKINVPETIIELKKLGIELKVITGDNRYIALYISKKLGLDKNKILTGKELNDLSDAALMQKVGNVQVFAEIEPNQKERIILAMKKAGNVVGYMGDGINDASALHSADVGISVDGATDVAKDAADIVLLEKDLSVLVEGVKKGRITFANTMKYVFMATSANFGNMFSMAGVSLFLPFLPLLPKQILLTNLFADIPEMTIATDSVDTETIQKPEKWNIKSIQNFMITFGLVSSFFDFLTFGILLFVLEANEIQFRTGWFMESVISSSVIILVIRTRKSLFSSRPSIYLLGAILGIAIITLILPYSPLSSIFGFASLPFIYLLAIIGITVVYIGVAECTKRIYFRSYYNPLRK